jgi:hypothetical protein
LLECDPELGTPGPFEPPQPASTASPSSAAIVADVRLAGSDRRRPCPRASFSARSGRCSWLDAFVMCFSDVARDRFGGCTPAFLTRASRRLLSRCKVGRAILGACTDHTWIGSGLARPVSDEQPSDAQIPGPNPRGAPRSGLGFACTHPRPGRRPRSAKRAPTALGPGLNRQPYPADLRSRR